MITILTILYIITSITVMVLTWMENEFLKEEIYQINLNEYSGIDRDGDGVIFEGTDFERKIL